MRPQTNANERVLQTSTLLNQMKRRSEITQTTLSIERFPTVRLPSLVVFVDVGCYRRKIEEEQQQKQEEQKEDNGDG